MADAPAGPGPAPPEPAHPPPRPAASSKLFSIFAPRPPSSASASGSTTSTLAPTPAPAPAAAAEPSTSSMARGAAAQRAASASAQSATGAETLSLVEDSGASDDGREGPEEGARRTRGGQGKGKGKVTKASRSRRAQDEDEDDEVVVVGSSSRAGKNGKGKTTATSTKAKGKKRAASPIASDSDDAASYAGSAAPSSPRTPRKRRSTTRRATAAPAHDAVVDLTESPPRKKKKKGDKKGKGKDKAFDGAGVIGTAGHAFSDERRAARDKAKKREAPEARWPTQEEHEGGLPSALAPVGNGEASNAAQGAQAARWTRREVTGKERVTHVEGEDEPGGTFLDELRATLVGPHGPSTSAATPGPVYSQRALRLVPNLLPPFAPHPLLDRLAAPLRDPSSSTLSAFVRPTARGFEPSEEGAKLWTSKYGPQSADEVLGDVSGQSARWLRDWLEELKVQGAAGDADAARRRRPVARGLVKPKKKKAKKRKPFDDFIASSDDDDDDMIAAYPPSSYDLHASDFGEDADDDDDHLLPSSSALRRPGSVFPTLTNLILLHGPHGTGKSAAVHAVARELNFEVFEVFPGMGRRGAKDLERYVGDVGRNHVVLGGSPRKGGASGGAAGGSVAAMFKRLQAKVEAGPDASGAAPGTKGKEKEKVDDEVRDMGPTQSLILVDEVDVLFKGEEDFWQGLIALAQQSRRPIVMTCTDYSLVPFDELGLQQVVAAADLPPANFLSFAAPEPDLAVPYLQLVALREGHILPSSSSTVDSLYSSFSRSRPYPAWLTQQQPGERPLPHPLSSMPLPSEDLRKALMQLQFECAWGMPGSASGGGEEEGTPGEEQMTWCEGALRAPAPAEDVDGPSPASSASHGAHAERRAVDGQLGGALERAALAADALSFADAHVARRIAVLLEDEETGRFVTPADAEASYTVLKYVVREDTQRVPSVGAEPAMVQAIDSLAFGLWEGAARFGVLEDEELESKRSDFTYRLGQLVHSGGDNALLQPPEPVLPSAAVTTDYRPYLRSITLADDDRLADSALASTSAADDGGPGEVHALGMAASLAAAAGPAGARRQRKSARQKARKGEPMYERVLGWASEVEANWLRASGFE